MYAVAMAPNDANGPPSGRRGCRRARTDAGGSSAKAICCICVWMSSRTPR